MANSEITDSDDYTKVAAMTDFKGWLCISKDKSTLVRAGDGYDESLGEVYSWDDTVQRATDVAVGDAIAIWNDRDGLLGFSWIEEIKEQDGSKFETRCPSCKKTDVRPRITKQPKFRCGKCKKEFNEPVVTKISTRQFQAFYAAGWTASDGLLSAQECRLLARSPKSQHSIRELDMQKFETLIGTLPPRSKVNFNRRNINLHNGHVLRTVKTRVGQAAFRKKLLEKYGYICAVSGVNYPLALEAAHLYSYSIVGKHHEDGGLFLRRDIHRLFDKGLITINPIDQTVRVHQDLREFAEYSKLHGRIIHVTVNAAVRSWLKIHFEEFG